MIKHKYLPGTHHKQRVLVDNTAKERAVKMSRKYNVLAWWSPNINNTFTVRNRMP